MNKYQEAIDEFGTNLITKGEYEGYQYGGLITESVEPETVGQFTGLKDKNGVEVYDGDICLINDIQFDEEEPFTIEWEDEMATFVLSSKTLTVTFDVIYARQLEIIGNIHDQKEKVEYDE